MFDEQPDAPPHAECAAEIAKLREALRVIAAQSVGPDWTHKQACAFMRQHARETLKGAQ
jgi:hypothetical protein